MQNFNVELIKNARHAAHMTQTELGKKVALARTSISMIESGKNRPSIESAKELGKALHFPWWKIFEDGTEQ